MFSSKYGNILTMILVVLIVAILGILGYFAYSFLYSKSVNNKANSALEEFKDATQSIKKEPSNTVSNTVSNTISNAVIENTVENNSGTMQDLLNTINQNPVIDTPEQNPEEKPEPEKVMMEDYEVLGYIEIPKTKVELPVLDNVTKRSLELSVGIAYGPGLNEPGNTIIFGHNYRNGLFFSNNKNLTNGDKIYITDKYNNTVKYIIYNIYETTQDDASYMQREVPEGVREISLQTCTDDSSGRIIIWAREERKINKIYKSSF